MRAKSFNPQRFLEFLCYCGFGILMLYLVLSGKYLTYVTPKMKPYLYFTALVMLVWACTVLLRIFDPQHKTRSAHCFVLAIPILLLLLPHSALGSSDFSGNNLGRTPLPNRSGADAGSTSSVSSEASASADPGLSTGNDSPFLSSPNLAGLDTENRKITVSNDDFGIWLTEIYMNPEKYKDYTIVMTGFVFKEAATLKADEFVPARLVMSCCAADLTPDGILCKYEKTPELTQDSWVTVEGVLVARQDEYEGSFYETPQINVTTVTATDPVEGYVYPY